MKFSFETTICDDIPVEVSGHYDAPDKSVGYWGSFDVEEVRTLDSKVNIISLLNDKTIERLEYAGMDAYEQSKIDAKIEAAEMRYQARKDNQLTGD